MSTSVREHDLTPTPSKHRAWVLGMLFGKGKLSISGEMEGFETSQHHGSGWEFSDFCRTLGAVQSPTALEVHKARKTGLPRLLRRWYVGFQGMVQKVELWDPHNTR